MIIYCIDDEKLNRDELELAIKKVAPKETLVMFDDPFDLLNEAKVKKPDVCFLDINMPEIDGMTLAKKLQEINKYINIIFVTGYENYSVEAYQMFASGYVLKPIDQNDVKAQLDNLRYKVTSKRKIFAQTFGMFSLLVDNKPVFFHSKRGKEILAYLIDRNGSDISRKELDSILFDDGSFSRENQVAISKAISSLKKDLEDVGAESILIATRNGYSIDKSKFDSDLFKYLKGDYSLYHGEYMEQYSWGEGFKGSQIKIHY